MGTNLFSGEDQLRTTLCDLNLLTPVCPRSRGRSDVCVGKLSHWTTLEEIHQETFLVLYLMFSVLGDPGVVGGGRGGRGRRSRRCATPPLLPPPPHDRVRGPRSRRGALQSPERGRAFGAGRRRSPLDPPDPPDPVRGSAQLVPAPLGTFRLVSARGGSRRLGSARRASANHVDAGAASRQAPRPQRRRRRRRPGRGRRAGRRPSLRASRPSRRASARGGGGGDGPLAGGAGRPGRTGAPTVRGHRHRERRTVWDTDALEEGRCGPGAGRASESVGGGRPTGTRKTVGGRGGTTLRGGEGGPRGGRR